MPIAVRAHFAVIAALMLGCSDGTETDGAGADAAADAFDARQACASKICGQTCTCPSCQGGIGFCAPSGSCQPPRPYCGCQVAADCPQPPPVCYRCPDGSMFCPAAECRGGICLITQDNCAPFPGYAPCAGKGCNDECTLCPPDATDCEEPPVARFCGTDPDQCSPGTVCAP